MDAHIAALSANRHLEAGLENGCYLGLLISMTYWKERHFVYAMEHGLIEQLFVYLNHPRLMDTKQSHETRLKWQMASILSCTFSFFAERRRLQAVMDKKVKIFMDLSCSCNQSPDGMNALIGVPMVLLGNSNPFINTQIVGKGRLMDEKLKSHVCGWPCCKLNRGKTRDFILYKCKGCGLLKYCSKRHQKFHWKWIHRQQCRRVPIL